MTLMMSHCVVMFLWNFWVRTEALSSLNFSSAEETDQNTTSPCLVQMGDVPYNKCGEDLVIDDVSTTEHNSLSWITSTVSPSTTENLTTPVQIHPTSTVTANTPPPASVPTTALLSPYGPKDTEPTAKPTTSLSTTDTVLMNHEDRQNTTASINCPCDPCTDLHVTRFNPPDQCRCPGVNSEDPEQPFSVEVKAVTHSVALVKWCATHSPDLEYLVIFRTGGLAQKTISFGPAARQVFVSDLTAEHTYNVCVNAVKRGKISAPRCSSVLMGLNPELYMYVLAVMCAVLMLTVMTLSVCLFKQCRKQPVENPHLTRLISIPNPAFFNP